MGNLIGYKIERLAKQDRSGFSCGQETLDRYLQHQAKQDEKRSIAVTYLLVEENTDFVAGYYTLSSTSIQTGTLPEDIAQKLPRYPVQPAILLGRLAIDTRFQGKNLGTALLGNALKRSYTSSREVGAFAVLVQALDDNAERFYLKFGFQKLPDQDRQLLLTMSTIAKLFQLS